MLSIECHDLRGDLNSTQTMARDRSNFSVPENGEGTFSSAAFASQILGLAA